MVTKINRYIREAMRAQVNRIGEAWEMLGTMVLVGTSYTPPSGPVEPFVHRGLKKEWEDFIIERYGERLKELQIRIDEKVGIFSGKPSYITRLNRWDFGGLFERADDFEQNCGSEKDQNEWMRE
jgi:hypothetical protein